MLGYYIIPSEAALSVHRASLLRLSALRMVFYSIVCISIIMSMVNHSRDAARQGLTKVRHSLLSFDPSFTNPIQFNPPFYFTLPHCLFLSYLSHTRSWQNLQFPILDSAFYITL